VPNHAGVAPVESVKKLCFSDDADGFDDFSSPGLLHVEGFFHRGFGECGFSHSVRAASFFRHRQSSPFQIFFGYFSGIYHIMESSVFYFFYTSGDSPSIKRLFSIFLFLQISTMNVVVYRSFSRFLL